MGRETGRCEYFPKLLDVIYFWVFHLIQRQMRRNRGEAICREIHREKHTLTTHFNRKKRMSKFFHLQLYKWTCVLIIPHIRYSLLVLSLVGGRVILFMYFSILYHTSNILVDLIVILAFMVKTVFLCTILNNKFIFSYPHGLHTEK